MDLHLYKGQKIPNEKKGKTKLLHKINIFCKWTKVWDLIFCPCKSYHSEGKKKKNKRGNGYPLIKFTNKVGGYKENMYKCKEKNIYFFPSLQHSRDDMEKEK